MAAEVAVELASALNLPLHVVRQRHWRQKGKNMAVNCDLHATVPRKEPHHSFTGRRDRCRQYHRWRHRRRRESARAEHWMLSVPNRLKYRSGPD